MASDWSTGPLTPYVGMVFAILGVSFASIFIRWSDSSPLVIATWRMLLVSLILLPVACLNVREELMSLERRDLYVMILIGLLLAAHFYTYITSVKMTSVASAILLASWHPVLVGLISVILLGESRHSAVLGILTGIAGLTLITWGDAGGDTLEGDLIALVSGVFFAGYLLLGRMLRQRISLVTYVFVVFSACAAFLLAGALVSGESLWPVAGNELLIFLALAIVSTIFGHLLFNFSLRYVGVTVVSVSYLGEPVGAVILAAILLSEMPSVYAIAGGAFILTGILLTARMERTASAGYSGRRPGR